MIHIVQPAIPKYRVPFFNKISNSYDCRFISTKRDFLGVNSEQISGNAVMSNGFFSFFSLIYWHKSLPLIKGYKKEDIVVVNGNPRVINYMLLIFLLKIRGIKVVWWGHGWSAGSHGILSKIRIKLMKIADAVLVYTEKEKKLLSFNNIYAVNNGLNSKEMKFDFKHKKKFAPKKLTLVFIGRITEKSNFSMLIEALSRLKGNVHLNVVGSCDSIDSYYELADSLEVQNQISWLGPLFQEDEISDVMLNSDVFVYPGSVGLSMIHAFNYALPVIVHSDEKHHMPEFAAFKNGINGVSFLNKDINDLVDKITYFQNIDFIDYDNMSKNALYTVQETYNVDDMFLRFDSMIRNLS